MGIWKKARRGGLKGEGLYKKRGGVLEQERKQKEKIKKILREKRERREEKRRVRVEFLKEEEGVLAFTSNLNQNQSLRV